MCRPCGSWNASHPGRRHRWCCDTTRAGHEYKLPGVSREGSLLHQAPLAGGQKHQNKSNSPRKKKNINGQGDMGQSISPHNCSPCAHELPHKETGGALTMLRLSVEQDLSVLDAVLRDGDDVTISAALAPAPQWPPPAHDACSSRSRRGRGSRRQKTEMLLAKIKGWLSKSQ